MMIVEPKALVGGDEEMSGCRWRMEMWRCVGTTPRFMTACIALMRMDRVCAKP